MYTVYGYFERETEECIYIGIAEGNGVERHQNHLKPSKYDAQEINKWLQDNPESWEYIELEQFTHDILDEKSLAHAYETLYVETFKPKLNVYKK